MKLSCIIVDDDLFSIDQMEEYVKQIPQLYLLQSFDCPIKAINRINELQDPIDIVFTDIEMPALSGIDFAKSVIEKVKNIIFITGHLKYAIEGYNLNIKNFILKPFDFSRFENVVLKLLTIDNSIIIKDGKKNEKVNLDSIIAFEGYSNYIKIHTLKKLLVCYYKLGAIEKDLEKNDNFIRINRSFIISKKHVHKIENKTIYLDNHLNTKVGTTYKSKFLKWIYKTV